MDEPPLPHAERPVETAAGHWVLARAGKRVLRPGGAELTEDMLNRCGLADADVIEFAPGLGRTAGVIVSAPITSYTGVDREPAAVERVGRTVEGSKGRVVVANANETGLPDACADVVVGEAMLTMQSDKGKAEIIREARRLLRPGGRYAIHEMALVPDDINQQVVDGLNRQLAQTIRANVRPLTCKQWQDALTQSGFVVEWVSTAPMALLSMRRNLADEGAVGMLRILKNLLLDRKLRHRVIQMRKTFNQHRNSLAGVAIIARVPEEEK